jgi:Ohr subfamily peroxiredoxin
MEKLYTAHVDVRSGREGSVRSDDGLLEARLAFPKSLGGDGKGTNPEQLFAAGYAACFGSTLAAIAKADKVALTDVAIAAEVDMLHEHGTFDLAVRLAVDAKGIDRATLLGLIEKAKQACPYSRATRSSLATTISVAEGVR